MRILPINHRKLCKFCCCTVFRPSNMEKWEICWPQTENLNFTNLPWKTCESHQSTYRTSSQGFFKRFRVYYYRSKNCKFSNWTKNHKCSQSDVKESKSSQSEEEKLQSSLIACRKIANFLNWLWIITHFIN